MSRDDSKRCEHNPCEPGCQGPIVLDGDLRYVSVSKVQLFDTDTHAIPFPAQRSHS